MIRRCHDPRHRNYKDYGGRGIAVCNRWRKSFDAFLEDMGRRPPGLCLDRIDNLRGYEPGNVRWVTHKANNRNRRNNRLLTHDGLTLTVIEWSERTGIAEMTLHARLFKGWDVARALTAPVRPRRKVDRASEQA
jgi:hypothetical protein